VKNFKYLGVIINEDKNKQIDLQERIRNANKTYFVLQNVFKNKNIKESKTESKEHNNRQNVNIFISNWNTDKEI